MMVVINVYQASFSLVGQIAWNQCEQGIFATRAGKNGKTIP